jgi:hypothetical protein
MKINQLNSVLLYFSVLRVRIGFNADPDPAFYLITDPDPGSKTNADPDACQTIKSQKVQYRQKHSYEGTAVFFERQETSFS